MSTDEMNAILGPCPICKKVKWWYNDLPLRAFCWGSPDDEHKEVRVAPTQRKYA